MIKKVSITGHTQGIGLALSNYFITKNYNVVGFSKSNGFDITNSTSRQKIIDYSKDTEIFVNNAYSNFDNSQLTLLDLIYTNWLNLDKIIINISTRFTNSDHNYSQSKQKLDNFCEQRVFNKLPYLINLKPGLTNTKRVESIKGDRMDVSDIVNVVDYILSVKNSVRVTSICFGK